MLRLHCSLSSDFFQSLRVEVRDRQAKRVTAMPALVQSAILVELQANQEGLAHWVLSRMPSKMDVHGATR